MPSPWRCEQFVTGKLRSYGAAIKDLGLEGRQEPVAGLTIGSSGYYVFIRDRLKEQLKVKGFRVAPAELESILLTH